MPEWFQCEGIDAVLDRLQAAGASALATSPYLMATAPACEGAREPPPDGDAGSVRALDRGLWGQTSSWIRTAPALVHDLSRYRGLRYGPRSDVRERCAIALAAAGARARLWVNRYGYLSDAKLTDLGGVVQGAGGMA